MQAGKARIRLFVIKESDELEFEVLKYSIFNDRLYSTPTPTKPEESDGRFFYTTKEMENQEESRLTDEQWIQNNIDSIGFEGIRDSIEEIITPYEIDDVVEILADYCVDGHWGNSMDGDEYEEEEYLENIQHNKLRDKEIARFIGPFKRNKNNLIEFLYPDLSLNHGVEEEAL